MGLEDLRCSNCGAKLARQDVRHGKVEIKCPSCNQTTVLIVTDRSEGPRKGYETRPIA